MGRVLNYSLTFTPARNSLPYKKWHYLYFYKTLCFAYISRIYVITKVLRWFRGFTSLFCGLHFIFPLCFPFIVPVFAVFPIFPHLLDDLVTIGQVITLPQWQIKTKLNLKLNRYTDHAQLYV